MHNLDTYQETSLHDVLNSAQAYFTYIIFYGVTANLITIYIIIDLFKLLIIAFFNPSGNPWLLIFFNLFWKLFTVHFRKPSIAFYLIFPETSDCVFSLNIFLVLWFIIEFIMYLYINYLFHYLSF